MPSAHDRAVEELRRTLNYLHARASAGEAVDPDELAGSASEVVDLLVEAAYVRIVEAVTAGEIGKELLVKHDADTPGSVTAVAVLLLALEQIARVDRRTAVVTNIACATVYLQDLLAALKRPPAPGLMLPRPG